MNDTTCAWVFLALLLGPVALVSDPLQTKNAGLIPFLISPFILTLFLPYYVAFHWNNHRDIRHVFSRIVMVFGGAFLLTYVIFGSPRPVAVLQGMTLLLGFSIFLFGTTVFLDRLTQNPLLAQWITSVVGLLLVGSFVYLSPVADYYYSDRPTRAIIIKLATWMNPVLSLAGGVLKKDLLRGSFLYEHLSIGQYYSYRAPSWIRVTSLYAVFGGILWLCGILINRSANDKTAVKDGEEFDR